MTKCFISFLGTSDYVACRYERGAEGFGPVRFVQTATLHLECRDWAAGDRVLIGCTRGARELNLDKLRAELVGSGWRFDPDVIDLPDGADEAELWQIFEALVARIGEGDELVFDITHAFRSLPLLFTVLIQYLRVVRAVRLRGVFYGAFERLGTPQAARGIPEEERRVPLLDLTPFLALYEWSAALDHFLRFGDAQELKRLVAGHVQPILRRTAGADADARTLRAVVDRLDEFARHARYARGGEIAAARLHSGIVEPLRRLREGFLPPLAPVLGRLEAGFAGYPDADPENVIRCVGWCIDHGLIQQGVTLLQEGLVSRWAARLQDLLREPSAAMAQREQERWRRDFVSRLLAVAAQRMPPAEWTDPLAVHRDVAEACLQRLPVGFDAAYARLTTLRNDINHAGFTQPAKWDKLESGLRAAHDALRADGADAMEAVAATASPRIYLLNTPVLTAYGTFRFSGPVEVDDARRRLAGGFVSAVGHEGAAQYLCARLGMPVEVSRTAIEMQPGDAALVLRLRDRLPEGAVLDARQLAAIPCEFGWLERLE